MALISISKIAKAARERGFKVRGEERHLEIFSPEHTGPEGIWWEGSCYSGANFIVNDSPSLGYGYNDAFNGPYHRGYTRDDAFGLIDLLKHPAMAGVTLN